MRVVTASTGQRGARREWLGLAVLALPTLLVALDIGALFLALPRLSADLGASGVEQLWITDIYGFMLAGFLITMGNLGDRIGRRKLLLIGSVAFTAASVLAAYASSPAMLIGARALLGVAAATLSPSTLALISNMFPDERQRGRAISLWAGCQFGGAAFGPVIGGLMLERFWWGSVFLLAVPVMLLLLLTGPVLLPEYRNPSAGRIDRLSVVMSLGAVLPIVYGVKEFTVGDPAHPAVTTGILAVGVSVGVLFVRRQLRLPDPLLDLGLLRRSSVRVALPAMLLASAALAGTSLMTTQYVQSVAGLGPAAAGVLQSPTGLGIAAGTLLAPLALRRWRPATAIVAGLGLSASGLLVLTGVDTSGWLAVVVVVIAVVAFGVGPLFVLGTGMVVGAAPQERAGSAASLSETSNVFGSMLGLAFLGSVGAAVYRHRMADVALSGVPADVARAARETIAGAVAASPSLAADLLAAARAAFTAGLVVTSGVGAATFLAIAVLLAVHQRRTTDSPDN
ncbi:MAG TPA: MFS transporter [Jiangellales bacterium]|nr:MFS transporter [Jiangellales bacterium]